MFDYPTFTQAYLVAALEVMKRNAHARGRPGDTELGPEFEGDGFSGISGAGKRNQATGFWCGRQTVHPHSYRNMDRVRSSLPDQDGMQPRCASLPQIRSQATSLASAGLPCEWTGRRPHPTRTTRQGLMAGDGDRSADRVVDHVRRLLRQHVPGVGNVHMLCAADAGGQVGGV